MTAVWVKNVREMLDLAAKLEGRDAKCAAAQCLYSYLCSPACDEMINHQVFVKTVKKSALRSCIEEEEMWKPVYKLALCRFRDDVDFFEKLVLLDDWYKVPAQSVSIDMWSSLDDFQTKKNDLLCHKVAELGAEVDVKITPKDYFTAVKANHCEEVPPKKTFRKVPKKTDDSDEDSDCEENPPKTT